MGFRELHHFKAKFTAVLQLAMAVYPGAHVEMVDEGLILKPSKLPVAPPAVGGRQGPHRNPQT